MSQHHNDGDGVWHAFGETSLPARSVLVAAGTQPNTVLAREDAINFHLDGKYFQLLDEEGSVVKPLKGLAKPEKPAVLTGIRDDGRATMSIRTDGEALVFDVRAHPHLAVDDLRDRVEALGGRVTIEPATDDATHITGCL